MSSPSILPFVTETAYAGRVGARPQVIYEGETVEGEAPNVFPEPEPDFYDLAPLRYDFPPVTLTRLRDVVVRGKSNCLTAADAILRHGLVDLARELSPELFYRRLQLTGDRLAGAWAGDDPFNVSYLPEAVVATDGVAFNYAHWLTEVLPRITASGADGALASVPLIVDTELHPNIARSIALVAGPDRPIHRLAPDAAVRVGAAHNVSPSGYVPFKPLADSQSGGICQGLFGGQALREMVGRLRAHAGGGEGPRPKLLIRRHSAMRHIVNEETVAEALVARGFVVVEPERLSLEEQVALYSRAQMVVGATGAAVANLIFCQPDCPTVVMMPKFKETAYWYWRRMAAAAGAGPVFHVSGEQVAPLDDPYHPLALHQDFAMEVKDVLTAVDAAESFSG